MPKTVAEAMAEPVNGNVHPRVKEPLVAPADSFKLGEQVNCSWRHIARAGVTKEDLKSSVYLQARAHDLTDWDICHVITADRAKWFRCLIVQGGRDGVGSIGSLRARMIVLEEVDIPVMDRNVNDGLPDGYHISFDGFRSVFIPFWGNKPLQPDGFPVRESARESILHHSTMAARATASR